MKERKCSRLWLAEAVRDGRVKGAEAALFERHAMGCADCAEEARALGELGALLKGLPTNTLHPLSMRRQRGRLMDEFDGALHRAPAPRGWSRAAAAGVAALVLVGVFSWLRLGHRAPVALAPALGATVEVRPEPGARWAQAKGPDFHRVELTEGTIGLRIQRSSSQTRVVIVVPDGSIEDFGTTLSVQVASGRTKHVVVEQGEVALRLEGHPEFRLAAGQSWSAPPDVLVSSQEPDVPSAFEPPPLASRPSVAPIVNHAKKAAKPAESSRSTAARKSDATEITAGNPEDTAYMQIIDLLRAGKSSDARDAALDYLRRFPNGFRRVEVGEVVRSAR